MHNPAGAAPLTTRKTLSNAISDLNFYLWSNVFIKPYCLILIMVSELNGPDTRRNGLIIGNLHTIQAFA